MPKSLEIVTAAGVLNNITGALAMSPNALTIETVRSGKQAMKQRLSWTESALPPQAGYDDFAPRLYDCLRLVG